MFADFIATYEEYVYKIIRTFLEYLIEYLRERENIFLERDPPPFNFLWI